MHIAGRHSVELTALDVHRCVLEALHEEVATNWKDRGITASVDLAHEPRLAGGSGESDVDVNPPTRVVAENADPRLSETSTLRRYECYPNALHCTEYSANPACFPLGLMMGTDRESTRYVMPSPLINAATLGVGHAAARRLVKTTFAPLWRNIIQQNIASPLVRHLRVLGCSLSLTLEHLTKEQLQRALIHCDLTITLVAELRAPSATSLSADALARMAVERQAARRARRAAQKSQHKIVVETLEQEDE